jgi:hypothetical protein
MKKRKNYVLAVRLDTAVRLSQRFGVGTAASFLRNKNVPLALALRVLSNFRRRRAVLE